MTRCCAAAALWATVALALGLSCTRKKGPMKKPPPALSRLVPASVAGWQGSRTTEYHRKTIFDALNGGAEIYLDYGFQRLLVREFRKPRRPGLTLHLFELKNAPDAYGLFTHEREGASMGVGEDSDYSGGLLRFWQGRHFVTVLSPRDTAEVKKVILALGREVASKLPRRGKRPAMIQWLPKAGRRASSVRYLHTHAALMHHLRLGADNVLGLDRSTAIALASYGTAAPLHALAVRFSAPQKATAALDAAHKWRPAAGKPSARFSARRCGKIFAAVWGPPPAAQRNRSPDERSSPAPWRPPRRAGSRAKKRKPRRKSPPSNRRRTAPQKPKAHPGVGPAPAAVTPFRLHGRAKRAAPG